MTCGAVVVAAGRSRRMGFNKTMTMLAGRMVLLRVLDVLDSAPEISHIIVVAAPESVESLRETISGECYRLPISILAGGETRQESVRNGVSALPEDVDLILIHDGARPLLTLDLIRNGVEAADEYGAAIAAIAVTDTIKLVAEDDRIEKTIDRSRLYAAQTPQVFRRDWLEGVYRRLDERRDIAAFTDESSMLEWAGYRVRIYPGSAENIKLTAPFDLTLAESILSRRERITQ